MDNKTEGRSVMRALRSVAFVFLCVPCLGSAHVGLFPEDYGVNGLSEILFTSRRMALERPVRVKAFRDASLRGWAYAMDHVDEAIDVILRAYAPGGDRAELEFEAATLADLMGADMVEIGYVSPTRWKRMMLGQGTMPGDPVGQMTEEEIEGMLFDEAAAHPSRRWFRMTVALLVGGFGVMVFLATGALSLRAAVQRRTFALAVASKRLVREKSQLEETGLMLRLERDFVASSLLAPTLRECLNRMGDIVLQIPGVDCCGVYLRNGKTGVFEMWVHRGLSETFVDRCGSYGADFAGYADLCDGRNVSHTAGDVPAPVGKAMREEGLLCILILPVAFESRVVALLHVGSRQMNAVPADMQTALESLSIRLGVVLAHFQAQERLRESEALFRRVAESAFDGVGLVEKDGRFRFVNDQMSQIFGYSAHELEGAFFTEVLPEEDVIRRMQLFRNRLAGKPVPEHFELNMRRKDGTLFLADVSVKLALWHGETGTVCAIRDISKRKRLEAQVLRIDEWEKVRIGQDLHDSVGQDLVGLSCLLKSLADALEKAGSPHTGKAAHAHAICMAAHEGLRGLVRGLLPLGSDECLADGLLRLSENIRVRGGVACVFLDGMPSLRLGPIHAKHLYYLAMEASANAIRHGGARSIVITLSQEDDDGVLRIDDDGSGFDVAAASRGGTGLDTMRYRANVLGGDLVVGPREGGGTTVRCVFPLQET